jgi:hypothetical protein
VRDENARTYEPAENIMQRKEAEAHAGYHKQKIFKQVKKKSKHNKDVHNGRICRFNEPFLIKVEYYSSGLITGETVYKDKYLEVNLPSGWAIVVTEISIHIYTKNSSHAVHDDLCHAATIYIYQQHRQHFVLHIYNLIISTAAPRVSHAPSFKLALSSSIGVNSGWK